MTVQLSWVRLSKMKGKMQLPQLLVDTSEAGTEGRNFSKYYRIRRQNSSCSSPGSQVSDEMEEKNKTKIPGTLRLKPRKGKKSAEVNNLPIKVKVKYKNLYGRVIEYAKHLPRTL